MTIFKWTMFLPNISDKLSTEFVLSMNILLWIFHLLSNGISNSGSGAMYRVCKNGKFPFFHITLRSEHFATKLNTSIKFNEQLKLKSHCNLKSFFDHHPGNNWKPNGKCLLCIDTFRGKEHQNAKYCVRCVWNGSSMLLANFNWTCNMKTIYIELSEWISNVIFSVQTDVIYRRLRYVCEQINMPSWQIQYGWIVSCGLFSFSSVNNFFSRNRVKFSLFVEGTCQFLKIFSKSCWFVSISLLGSVKQSTISPSQHSDVCVRCGWMNSLFVLRYA